MTRTCDPLVPNQMRYQLRHTPNSPPGDLTAVSKGAANIYPFGQISKLFTLQDLAGCRCDSLGVEAIGGEELRGGAGLAEAVGAVDEGNRRRDC